MILLSHLSDDIVIDDARLSAPHHPALQHQVSLKQQFNLKIISLHSTFMKNLVYISMKGICYQPEGRQCWCHPSCHRCAGSQRAFDQLWSQSWDGKHEQIMFGVYSFSCVRQFLPVKIPPVHCYLWKVLPSDYYRYYYLSTINTRYYYLSTSNTS